MSDSDHSPPRTPRAGRANAVASAPRMRQLVDWSAAIWAGVIAAIIFLLLNLFLTPLVLGGNAWVIVRLFASITMGEPVLAPPATFHGTALAAALLTHFVLSIGFAMLIAYILHRWGLIVGILGGAIIGLGLFCINFYTMTVFFPWFFAMRSWVFVLTHVLFGAIAGGVYEGLEVEEFEPIEDAPIDDPALGAREG
jgi:hypothetical protein